MAVLRKCKSEFHEIKIENAMSTLAIHDDNDKSITTRSNQKRDITAVQKRKTRKYKTPRKGTGEPRNIRPIHKRKLTCLLNKLMRFHRWNEASGVLSVLLQATEKDIYPEDNRPKYWAAVELAHKEGSTRTFTRVQRIYDVWTKKNGKMKSWSTKKKYMFQIEFLLYSLTTLTHRSRAVKTRDENKKDALREAELTITHLVNNKDFESEPIANIVVGLIYFELWYMSSTLEEMKLRNSDTYERPAVSVTSGMNSHNEIGNLDGQNSVNVGNSESTVQRGSGTSFAYKKKHHMDIIPLKEETKEPSQEQGFCDEAYKKKHHVDIIPLKEETRKPSEEQGFSDEESSGVIDDEEMPSHNRGGNTSIFYSRGLQTSLLPLRLPNLSEDVEDYIDSHRGMVNEDYNKAVKHLQCALYSTPPVLASLLPLVQLLLLGDQVEAALEELENICQRTDAELPFRLKANLLEGFHGTNALALSTCYENILMKNSTCSHAVTNLISLYKNGDYSLELLVGMIALHLDETSGSCSVWEQLASCFVEVSQIEDVLESTNSNSEGSRKTNLGVCSKVAKRITNGRSSLWKPRPNSWSKRHFDSSVFLLEMHAGDWNLLASKAACASHLYGPEFDYVKKVCNGLEMEKNTDLLLLLQKHRTNSIRLFEHVK